jgi:hypothetical protein
MPQANGVTRYARTDAGAAWVIHPTLTKSTYSENKKVAMTAAIAQGRTRPLFVAFPGIPTITHSN